MNGWIIEHQVRAQVQQREAEKARLELLVFLAQKERKRRERHDKNQI